MPSSHRARSAIKGLLARIPSDEQPRGATLLIYHRVGGGTGDELDVSTPTFATQLDILSGHDVIPLDAALDRVEARDPRPSVVLTFDDGFEDVHTNAWPLLRERRMPFTIYLASAYTGRTMVWEGSTAEGTPGRGLTWAQLDEMHASGLLTIGNHTHRHVRPEQLTHAELDECSDAVERHLGVRPGHFAYPWGVALPDMDPALATRFRSAATGAAGRVDPSTNLMRLPRVPVRRTDPMPFFAAKLTGALGPERAYARLVHAAKAIAR